ncbi:MAG: hypothetical protein JWM47_442 [Acidimicrobiales bacterium]|nr:hypothetical protein [Acidimicrobiales bacterium]
MHGHRPVISPRRLLARSAVGLALGVVGAGLVAVAAPAGAAPSHVVAAGHPARSIPAAGSSTSSPLTGITLTGVASDSVGPLVVVGSRSGRHEGSVVPLPGRDGVAFSPETPFAAGEEVTVTTSVPVVGGDEDGFTFTVATPGTSPGPQVIEGEGQGSTTPESPSTRATPAPKFVTRPDLRPPGVTVNVPAEGTAPGYLFATPNNHVPTKVDQGVMIYDDSGEPVWFRKVNAGLSGNAFVGTYDGRPALIWYEGDPPFNPGNYRGEWVVVDQSYRELARIRTGNGYQADIHDLYLTEHGTAYAMAYNPLICTGVAPLVGCTPGAVVLDGVLQEVDLATGLVLWEWHTLDHIDLDDSYLDITLQMVDYVHINSVGLDTDGDVLMSARSTSALYKIDRETGELVWTFGGKSTDFPNLVGEPNAITGPDFPHHLMARGGNSYSYFDNGSRRSGPSRGAVVTLNPGTGTATYTKKLIRDPAVFANTQGSMQGLAGGHELIAWGDHGIVTEYDAGGTAVFDARLTDSGSYRQFRHGWTGTPAEDPVARATLAGGDTSVSMSWNGDTRTANWRILTGPSPEALAPAATVARTGFETTATIAGSTGWVAVEALDGDANVIGRSVTVEGSRWFRELPLPSISQTYKPVVGDFGGSRNDDVLYYRPGSGADYLHLSDGTGSFNSLALSTIGANYTPLVGDFVGDDRDEVLWWRPGVATAYLWRFDLAKRSSAAPTTASASVTVPTVVTKPLVLDNRPNYGGGYDELLWYAVGTAPDRVDRFSWPLATGLVTTSRALSVTGNYTPVTGDFDGNGWGDVLWYANGPNRDAFWFFRGDATGSVSQRSVTFFANGSQKASVGNFIGTEARDEVLWAASGPAADALWTFDATGAWKPSDATSTATGAGYVLSGANDQLMSWVPGGSPTIWQLTTNPTTNRPSGNAAVAAGYQPLVGDFVGAGGTSSVLWYAPGAPPEVLYAHG